MEIREGKLVQELKKNLGFSDVFTESIQDGLLITDEQGTIVIVNSAFCNMTGYPREKLLGSKLPLPFWPTEFQDEFNKVFQELLREGLKGEFESIHMLRNGVRFPVSLFVAAIRRAPESNEKPLAHLALMIDMSAAESDVAANDTPNQDLFSSLNYRKKYLDLITEKKLLAQLDYTLNNISDGIISLDTDWRYIYMNKKATELLGKTSGNLIGKKIWAEFPEIKDHTFYRACHKAFATQVKQVFHEFYKPFGRWYENRIYPSATGLTIYFSDITEKKEGEMLLIREEKILHLIKESLTQPLFILQVEPGQTLRFISASNSFLDTLALREDEVANKFIDALPYHPTLTEIARNSEKAMSRRETVQWEAHITDKSGTKTEIITLSPLCDVKKDCTHVVGIMHDITERKKVEELRIQNEKYLDNILNNIGDPVFVKDSQSRLLLVNDSFCQIFGLSRADILGKTLEEEVPPGGRGQFLKIDRAVISTGIEHITEEQLTVRSGESKILSTKKTRFVDEQGKKHLIGIIRDITAVKKAEFGLKAAKEYSDDLIESLHEGLVVFNMETEIIRVNPAFCRMSGFPEEELLGRQCPYPFSPPEIEEEANRRHAQITRGEEPGNFETVYIRKDGTRFHAEVMISRIKNPRGGTSAYFGTIVDTTDRKKAELNLRVSKEFTDKLIMSMQEGLIIVDLKGQITMVNDSTYRILGYTREELVGLNLPYPFAKPGDLEEISKTNEKVAAGQAPSFQFEFIRKNGEKFMASFLTGNISNDKGETIALFGTMKDISDEVRAKKALEEIALKSTKKKDVILTLANMVGRDFKGSLDQITELAAKTLNVERVSVWRFGENPGTIICENLYTLETDRHQDGMMFHRAENRDYFRILEKERTIWISDAQKNKLTRQFASDYLIAHNIQSLMDVLINSTKGFYGILCFEHVGTHQRDWTADEQEFATSIANIVSLMVESSERKVAETKLMLSNDNLAKANAELNKLREQLEQENIYLRNELDLVFNFEEMVYGSVEFTNVLSDVEKVAPTNATVLLLGESGTGKELLARAIHNIGLRNNKPLIKVNCSAIPRELIESELFGHKKGSFTGAFSDKIGKFELADGGTLFLDEIGELPLDMQPKILRFLQEGEIEVIGGTQVRKLDVRVIAATNRNLKEEIEKKQFREDLYFRLNVFPIEVPPLRKRREDIPLLVEHFVDRFNKDYSKNIKFISDEAMEKLKAYDWPGNIRELENLIERAAILSNEETLLIPGFESELQKSKMQIKTNNLSLDSVQRNHILTVLEQCNWKISGADSASSLLNMKPSTLRDKMTRLGIQK